MYLTEKLLKVTTWPLSIHMKHFFNTDLHIILHSCGVNKSLTCSIISSFKCSNFEISPKNTFYFNKLHIILKSHWVKSGDLAGQSIVHVLPIHSTRLSFKSLEHKRLTAEVHCLTAKKINHTDATWSPHKWYTIEECRWQLLIVGEINNAARRPLAMHWLLLHPVLCITMLWS